jgi:hypothetical protein
MIKIILQVVMAFIIFRLIGSVFGLFRGHGANTGNVGSSQGRESVHTREYDDLTPYEIEDAEYEELPKRD